MRILPNGCTAAFGKDTAVALIGYGVAIQQAGFGLFGVLLWLPACRWWRTFN